MDLLKKYPFQIAGLLLGALGGFLYWNFIGCQTGNCMISSSWMRMTPYGAMMGLLTGSLVQDMFKNKDGDEEDASDEGDAPEA